MKSINLAIYTIVILGFSLMILSPLKASEGSKTSAEKISITKAAAKECARFDVSGIATQKYDSVKACGAAKNTLNASAAGDAKSQCSAKCEALDCTYKTIPAKPKGTHKGCKAGSKPKTAYGASQADITCVCLER